MGDLAAMEVRGTKIVVCRVGETLYAYQDSCPSCSAAVRESPLRENILTCSSCGRRYDVRRAGQCIDGGAIHLAYELLEKKYAVTILVDATPRGGQPGTVYLIEPDLGALGGYRCEAPDEHGMNPESVLAWLKSLGGDPGRVFIVGCEPACVEESLGLSAPVAQAVEEAMRLVREIIQQRE